MEERKNVFVRISHSNRAIRRGEIKLDLQMTIGNLKLKLFTLIGTSPPNMRLVLLDKNGRKMCPLVDDSKPLESFSPYDGCTVHVIDTEPRALINMSWLEDDTKTEKYVMSDAEYSKRENSFRKFKQQQLQQQQGGGPADDAQAPDASPGLCSSVACAAERVAELAEAVCSAGRCIAEPGARKGVVRYVGPVESMAAGIWVGVALDEPLGRHDGSKGGRRYFEAEDGHGIFVRPASIMLGGPAGPQALGPGDEL